ncbi:MAG: hypothetical protein WDO16_25080 [Bacteroidota bacterium]
MSTVVSCQIVSHYLMLHYTLHLPSQVKAGSQICMCRDEYEETIKEFRQYYIGPCE